MPEPETGPVKAHCNKCGDETNHKQLKADTADWTGEPDESGYRINSSTTYEMLKCLGCDSVTLRRSHWFSEWDGEQEITYFPPAVSRPTPSWIADLDEELGDLLKEVYTAMHADSRRLAMMGARTVIDRVALDTVGELRTFGEKLEALKSKAHVSEPGFKVLYAALEAGNAAVHRCHHPSKSEVSDVMDIVENLLHAVYVIPKAAERLAKTTPPKGSKRN